MWKLARRKKKNPRRTAYPIIPQLEGLEERAMLASFQGLDFTPIAISDDGSSLLKWGTGANGNGALFRWTPSGGDQEIFNDPQFNVYTISDDGAVIAGVKNDKYYIWTEASSYIYVAEKADVFGESVNLYDIHVSADGSAITYGVYPENPFDYAEKFYWSLNTGRINLGHIGIPPGGIDYGHINDISGDGLTVVGYELGQFADQNYPFRWTQSTGMVPLSGFSTETMGSIAYATSDDGSVIVGRLNTADLGFRGTPAAFRWSTEDGLQKLFPEHDTSTWSWANDVSADGSVIVGQFGNLGIGNHVYIWNEAGGVKDILELLTADPESQAAIAGWTLYDATMVSANGKVIVGMGWDPQGQEKRWVVYLDDAPESLSDISITHLSISSDSLSIVAQYSVTRHNLPTASTIALYWASGREFSDRIGAARWIVKSDVTADSGEKTIEFAIANLGRRPENATHIIAVADSPDLAPNHNSNGSITEFSETNNLLAIAVEKPDAFFDYVHTDGRIIYYSVARAGNIFPLSIGLYQSSDKQYDQNSDSLVMPISQILSDEFRTGQFALPQSFVHDASRPNLVIVVDPIAYLPESNEQNNAVTITLADRIIASARSIAQANPVRYKFSSDWDGAGLLPSYSFKCNLFVYDALNYAAISVPSKARLSRRPPFLYRSPITAIEWANSRVSGFTRITRGSPRVGDIITDGIHMGIVTSQGTTISVLAPGRGDMILENNWGFRPENRGRIIIQRPNGLN